LERRAIIACGVFVVLTATLLTNIYDGLDRGEDQTWLLVVLAVGATLGLGALSRRAWSLAGPVVLCCAFIANAASDLAWLIVLFAGPVLLVAALVGWLIGRFGGRAGIGVGVAAFGAACVVPVIGIVDTVQRESRPRLPERAAARLPLDVSLGNLCDSAGSDPGFYRDVERRAEALIDELHRRPDHIVTVTVYYAHGGGEDEENLTVRELAEEELHDLEIGGCRKKLRQQLRDGIERD
jgi:hypothetical protein